MSSSDELFLIFFSFSDKCCSAGVVLLLLLHGLLDGGEF